MILSCASREVCCIVSRPKAATHRRIKRDAAILCGVLGLVMTACAVTPSKGADKVLVETPHGTVFLQKAEDEWFGTAHPISLSPTLLASVFRGMHVNAMPTGIANESRVFSEEDTEFLCSVISTALSKATKRQVVGFRVIHRGEAGHIITGGILYVQGYLLHLTITHYRAREEPTGQDGIPGRLDPNPTGLAYRIKFIPEAAEKTSRNEQPDVINTPALVSLVVDYTALAMEAVQPSPSERSDALRPHHMPVILQPAQPIPPVHHGVHPPEAETAPTESNTALQKPVQKTESIVDVLEVLQEEVRAIQRRLAELERERQKTEMQ